MSCRLCANPSSISSPSSSIQPQRECFNLFCTLLSRRCRKQKEESAKLLCLLIGAAAGLVKNYAPTILTVLLRTAGSLETSVPVAAHCVTCIGELARVAGEELVPNVTPILDLVVGMLNDQTSTLKRDAALRTLGQIVSNTGEVIKPYIDHPQLLGILFRFLRTETSTAIRLETIRTMGMLGALDPFKHKVGYATGTLSVLTLHKAKAVASGGWR